MDTVPAKHILSPRSAQPERWFGVEYTMNLYRGCCHGCIYCDSRSECYGIEDFEHVRVKEHCLKIVERELRGKQSVGVVGTGAMSDPYNPFEREGQYTRRALELLRKYGFGVSIATKSDLVTRDIDVLRGIQETAPVLCKITVTTTDDSLAAKLEPYAPPPSARLRAVEQLADGGIYTGLLLMPVLPFLEDNAENVRDIVRRAADAGAKFIYPAFGVTLRDRQRAYYYEKLDALFPNLKQRYIAQYGGGYSCGSPQAEDLYQNFAECCQEHRLVYRMEDIIRGYRGEDAQLTLF